MFGKRTCLVSLVLASGFISACLGLQNDPDLVGWWNFNEGSGAVALDLSPHANHGALQGDPQWTLGVLDGALEFDGSTDSVEIPHNPSLSITDAITIAAWTYMSDSASGEMAIVSKGGWGANDLPYELTETPGDVIFWQFYDDEGRDSCSPVSPPASEWHHIAATYDGTAFKCYINGALAEEWGYVGTMPENNAAVTIGRRSRGGSYFEGMIDDVAIFTRALTDKEIMLVMAGGVAPELAMDPIPEDGAADVPRDVMLRWTPGQYAQMHDVYLGTVFDDVNEADRINPLAVLVGKDQEAHTFDSGPLDFGTTYYWRIDEVNAPPDSTVFKGDVWQFEVEPVSFAIPMGVVTATASSMDGTQDPNNTVNGSGLNENDEHSNLLDFMWAGAATDVTPWIQFEFAQVQKLDKAHVWNHNTQTEAILGFGIKEAKIEASVDGETWSDLGTVELAQAPGTTTYTGFELALNGTVARFIRITALSNHSLLGLPQKGLSEVRFYAVPTQARLENPVNGSAGLDPLVDLNWRAGREAAQHEVLLGTDPEALTLVATVNDPAYAAAVELDSMVYWRVNEVNDAMDPTVWEGNLWFFDTAAFATVDDMESYKSEEGSFVWETWTDGFGDDGNGALLGHNGDNMETDIVYDGRQSLPYYYGQGGAGNSEASRDINRDWGQHGIVSLSLMFYGASSNVPGQMFIKLDGEKIGTYPVSSDMKLPQWQAWTLDLPASALGNVKSLAIGFEGGSGVVMIDAIRLYAKASETVVGVAPDDTDLVAHYAFEGNANDVSGNGNNGTLEGGPQYVTGKVGDALDFDGIDDYVSTGKVASQLGIDGNKPRTVSAWVYTRGYANGGIFDVGARVNGEDFSLRTLDDVANRWRIQYWGGDFDFTFNTLERWVHFTHVHDGTHTRIYADGRLIVNWEKTIDTTDTNPFQIGLYGWPGNFFYGVIDEVRVYSRALSQAEAMGLAGRTGTDPIFREF